MYIAYNNIYMEVNMFFESKNTHSERQSLKHSVQQSIQRSIQHSEQRSVQHSEQRSIQHSEQRSVRHSEQRSVQHGPQHRGQHRLLLKKAILIFALALTVSSVTEYAAEFNAPVAQAVVTEKNIKQTSTAKKQPTKISNAATSPYKELNGNKPEFTRKEKKNKKAFETYSRLDKLGRCGVAYANVCKEIMPVDKRGPIGQVRPSGWHTVKYNDLIDGNYLYNRCHLIGYQLAGENANVKNLITGTRFLNVEGMLPFENMVADYVNETGNHVLYRVTPVFEKNNLVAKGVKMEAWSVEDKGSGICFNVFCYNTQPGIIIDYSNGNSHRAGKKVKKSNSGESSENVKTADYIINTNTGKYHVPSCSSVRQMKEFNKKKFKGTEAEIKKQGYSPCKRCIGR